MDFPARRSLIIVLVALACWTSLQVRWLAADQRLPDGDAFANTGTVELFWEETRDRSAASALVRAYTEDFGEYPALYPASIGIATRWAGVDDMNGDGPATVGLLWSWLAVLATWWLGLSLGGGRTALLGSGLLMISPLWSALQRQVMLENGITALTALVAAAGFAATLRVDRERRLELWALAGIAAGAALLVKQTALLAIAPIALGLVVANGRRWAGPGVAGLLTAAVAGPWYLGRVFGESEYLTRSLQANPDAGGWLQQLLYYPLVMTQQVWPTAVVLLGLAIALLAVRRGLGPWPGRWALLAAMVGCGLVLLLLLPKKYPRLLLPLLPLGSVLLALALQRWSTGLRRILLRVAGLAWLSTVLPMGPLSSYLGTTELGLAQFDERCFQRWTEPADPQALDWDSLLALLEEAGGPGTPYRVGAATWPAPPCSYQTSWHLGEHLRVRVRRAGLEAYVLDSANPTGEIPQTQELPDDYHPLPTVLVTDGPPGDCPDSTESCTVLGLPAEAIGRWSFVGQQWPLELGIYRVLSSTPDSPEPPM